MKQQLVPFCCACGKVKDELGSKVGQGQWVDLHSYRMTHGFRVADLSLTKTYCADCGHLYQMLNRRGSPCSTAEERTGDQGERVRKGEQSHHGQ